MPRARTQPSFAVAAALVAALALAVRLAHLFALRASFEGTGLFDVLTVDALHHWNEALRVVSDDPLLADRPPWKGPGYSYFLAAAIALLGPDPSAVRFVHAVLGALNVLALAHLARRVVSDRAALVAAAFLALCGTAVVFDAELYQPTLLVALTLGALLLVVPPRPDAAQRSRPPTAAAFLGAGFLVGLAVLTHAAFLASAAALVAWAALARAPRARLRAAALAAGIALAVGPWTVTNVTLRDTPVLVSWNGGINFYAANHPTFDQRAGNGTNAWTRILETPVAAGIEGEAARDRLYWTLAIENVARRPLASAGVFAEKLALFFAPTEIANNFRFDEIRARSPVARALMPFMDASRGIAWHVALYLPTALVGCALFARRVHGVVALAPFLAAASGPFLANVLFFNTARFRLPALVLLAPFAAYAVVVAWDAVKTRTRGGARAPGPPARTGRRAAVAWVALVATGVGYVAWLGPQTVLPPPYAWYEMHARAADGRTPEAERWVERTLAADPDFAPILQGVSSVYARWGDRERQRALLERLLALPDLEPDLIDRNHERLADSYFAEGRYEDAERELEAALAVGADDTTWRGYPYYAMGLGPMRACALEAKLLDLAVRAGSSGEVGRRAAFLRRSCPNVLR